MIEGHQVSVLIPCLNEAGGLRQVLPSIPAWVDETLVVDNGSTDRSPAIARSLGARVVHEARRGYGSACLRGLREASGELIVKCDGDGTYPAAAIGPLLQQLLREPLDFISACRFPLRDQRAMSWQNRFGNRVLTVAANVCFGLQLTDSLSGMWAVRRSAIGRMRLTQHGIAFSQEIKVEAFCLGGMRAREVPIEYSRRIGTSKLMPIRDGFGCLMFLIARRLETARRGPAIDDLSLRPSRDFR